MCSGYSHLHVCIAGVYLQSVTSFCTVLMVSLEAQRLILRKSSLLVFSPFSGFYGPCIFACPHVMEILHLLTVSLLGFSHMGLWSILNFVYGMMWKSGLILSPRAYHVICIVYWEKNSFSTQGPLLLIKWSYMCSCITWLTVSFLGVFVYPCSNTTLSYHLLE